MNQEMDIDRLYGERFSATELEAKHRVWRVLCRHFFQRYVQPQHTVLDMGAGACEFINNIQAGRRIAVDLNPELQRYADDGVETVVGPSTRLQAIEESSVDVVFASNFFEHLPDTDGFLATLKEIRRVLVDGGRLLILQPNIAVLGGAYWDFLDHNLPLTEKTVAEALDLLDFEVLELRRRFLPYTSKGRLPQHPLLVRLYLLLPPVHRLLGGQAWIVARKPATRPKQTSP